MVIMFDTQRLKLLAMLRIREIIAYCADSIFELPKGQKRLVIFAQGRTGSTLLETLLCSTGHFCETGEILNSDNREIVCPRRFILGEAKRRSSENFIFHVKIYHLTIDRAKPVNPAAFLRELNQCGWDIVFLKRENLVRHALSSQIAREIGAYHLRKNHKIDRLRLNVNVADLGQEIDNRLRFADEEQKALSGLNVLEFSYERDLESPRCQQATVDTILDYVGLTRRKASAVTKRINNFAPNDLIANYSEVVRYLESRNLAELL